MTDARRSAVAIKSVSFDGKENLSIECTNKDLIADEMYVVCQHRGEIASEREKEIPKRA